MLKKYKIGCGYYYLIRFRKLNKNITVGMLVDVSDNKKYFVAKYHKITTVRCTLREAVETVQYFHVLSKKTIIKIKDDIITRQKISVKKYSIITKIPIEKIKKYLQSMYIFDDEISLRKALIFCKDEAGGFVFKSLIWDDWYEFNN